MIFDMDGVLTDSEPAFHAAVNDILARYGTASPVEEYQQFIGMHTPAMWSNMLALKGIDAPLEEVLRDYEAPLIARLREPRPALPGARELIDKLRARQVPLGLCTASYMRWVEAILDGAGLRGLFDAYSTADDGVPPKPDAAPYVLAAAKLGMRPEACIAVEDSTNGLTSALGSGACVVQLRATSTAAPPMAGVALVMDSLRQFPTGWVEGPPTRIHR